VGFLFGIVLVAARNCDAMAVQVNAAAGRASINIRQYCPTKY
jgi:hypothetical protein